MLENLKLDDPMSQDFARFALACINAMAAYACVVDRSGRIVLINDGWRDFFEENFADAPCRHVGGNYLLACEQATCRGSDAAASVARGIREVIDGKKQTFTLEYPMDFPQQRRWFRTRVSRFPCGDTYAIIAHESITLKKRAERSLIESFSIAGYLECALNEYLLLTITDTNGKITYANEKFCATFRCSQREVIGTKHHLVSYSDEFTLHISRAVKALRQGNIWKGEVRIRAMDGASHWLDTTIVPMQDKYGNIFQYVTASIDVTSQQEHQQSLSRSNRELRDLAIHLDNVREYERKRIAREIHDDLGQNLLSLSMYVASISSKDCRRGKVIGEAFDVIKEGLDASIKCVRSIINDLRPTALESGLSTAIESYVQTFSARTGILCDAEIAVDSRLLDQERTITIYRILQESLANVVRHSQGNRVSVTLKTDAGNVVLKVSDNGVGSALDGYAKRGSFGILGMRERIHSLGGSFNIEARHGGGTRLTASVPFN